jgi:cation diffusion facilitator CzcD-associated flavoprotein CzcO
MRRERLVIIGAGPVGLAMAAALRREAVAFEHVDANAGLGGNWHSGVYETTHIVSSKRSTAFADYPMPADYPDFPSARQMQAYLESFARDRDLARRIEFGRRVVEARPQPDDTWVVRFENGEQRTYKGVVVCNGHHWDPIEPELPGSFSGRVMHARFYKSPADVAGARVLVIGAGNSGCDIASECARVARSTDWSMRSGAWFLPKVAFGRPLTDLPVWSLPVPAQRLVLKGLIRLLIGRYRDYGLPEPSHRLFERHPTFGTEALGYIRQGRIRPRPAIAQCDGRKVRFTDGGETEVDLIVAATGYKVIFPFLPKGLVDVRDNVAQIYGGAFPPRVKNLYIVGSEQPRNGFGAILSPAAALYARLIAMQDEFDHPIGSILEFGGERLPTSQYVDPAKARRRIRWGRRLLAIMRLEGRILDRRRTYRPIALDLPPAVDYRDAAE